MFLGKLLGNFKFLKLILDRRGSWCQMLSCDYHILLQKFGKPVEATDQSMTGERCGYLCAVVFANKLHEAWMSLLPYIPLCYIFMYYPNIGNS
jgi:hypothetical protein